MTNKRLPEVVTGVYIFDEQDRLLLTKSHNWGDQWMIPGGHVELGETVLDCARREASEEVGIDVLPEGVLIIAEDIYPEAFHEKDRHMVYFEVVCRAKDAKVKIDNNEIQEYGWFGPEEALAVVKEPVLKRTIDKYIRNKKDGKMEYIDIRKFV